MIECPYCKKKTYFYYAPSCNIDAEECEHCKKTFKIAMSFKGIKNKISKIKIK